MHVSTAVILLALLAPVRSEITCYHGMQVTMPGIFFNHSMESVFCPNANYCLRSFGMINGKEGWFASCVRWKHESERCGENWDCLSTSTPNGVYNTCCCNTELCNNVNFIGNKLVAANVNTGIRTASEVIVLVVVALFNAL